MIAAKGNKGKIKGLCKVSIGIFCSVGTQLAFADVATGQKWLASQKATSGIANNLQTSQEVSSILSHLKSSNSLDAPTATFENEASSEGLVRLILIAKSNGKQLPQAWQTLAINQNEDGGFGHIEGWQSNPLDTAYTLIALQESDYLSSLDDATKTQWQTRISKALYYLATQQQKDGSYKIAYLDELYINSYVLSSLTPYLKQYGQYLPVAQKLVNYLQSKQTENSTWSTRANNTGLFIDALVAESLYPYQASTNAETFKTNFTNRVLALQNADGSWQNDAYVTAIVLRSLDSISKPISNPMTSSISLSIIDAESGIGLTDVILTNDDNTVRLNSDSAGNIILQDVKAGNYQFTLTKIGFAPVSFSVTLKQGEQLNLGQIRLSRFALVTTGQIQGTVTDKVTKSPLVDAVVTVVLVDDNGNKIADIEPIQVKTDNQGRYQITLTKEQLDVSKGRFGIHIARDGYAAVAGHGVVQLGGITLFSPTLTSIASFNASLLGKVVDINGQPLSGTNILYQGKPVTTTDTTGAFVVNNLPMGNGKWELQLTGYQTMSLSFVVDQSIAYNAGIITLAKQQLSDPNDPNSQPLPATQGGFFVTPIDSQSKQSITNFTVKFELLDASGKVIQTQSIAPNENQVDKLTATLPTGKWRITVNHPAYQTVSQTFDLKDKTTIDYKPVMVLNPYTVTGIVVDSLTNQPIVNAPVRIINTITKAVLFTGQTNNKGQFTAPSNLAADDIQVEVTPVLYLSTTRYISRDYETSSNIDMGEIRLRPKSAEIVLPDLTISQILTDKSINDQQTLSLSGDLSLTVINKGNSDLLSRTTVVTAFIDDNHNRKFDKEEQVVGSKPINLSLNKDESAAITLPVSGKLAFRDAPIAVMIDSDGQVAERDESNNIRLTSDGIQIQPKQGTMDAEVVWQNNIASDSGAIAAPLSDTNGDGIIGDGDVASILVYSGGQHHVLDGKTGQEQFKLAGGGAQELAAIGDVDGDKLPDIIVTASDGLRIYDNKGQLKKTLKASLGFSGWSSNAYHPIIADLNKDGIAEIIQNNKIFNYEKGLIKDGLPSGQSQAVADMNGDGSPDIIGLSGVSDNQGNLLYRFKDVNNRNITLKFIAIGDVLGTKQPQVIAIYGNQILILDGKTGQTIATYNAPASQGGSPVIADFDGDGRADIGVARTYNYVAMRGDGSIIWNTPISDGSGGTGSTVFDFDNDGKTEAIHFDEQHLRIYDAATGVERIKLPNRTATAHEYPIVGDFDGDGHADIIITSGSGNGVRMISSRNKDWANTRNIWNQYSYHVTNTNDDLTIPTNEPNSWEVHNTYRANLLLNQNATAAVDLTTSYLQIKDNGTAPSQFVARIGNAGGKVAKASTPVSFYQKDSTGQSKLLGVVKLPKDLASDEYVDLSLSYSPVTGNLHDFGDLIVIANDAGAGIDSATGIPNPTDPTKAPDSHGVIQEYTRDNNIATLAVTGDFAGFSLAANLDKTSYTADETVKITSIPTNLGSFDTNPTVKVSILDSAGNTVTTYPEQAIKLGSALTGQATGSNTTTLQNFWNTSQQRTGNYTVHVELLNNNKTVASVDKPFAIVADGIATGQVDSQLYTDKTQYNTTDLVQVHSRLINTASNAMATARNVALAVKDEQGQTIWTQSYSYNELSPNALKDQYFTVPLNNVKQGKYTVTSITTASDGSQSQQQLTKTFEVLSAAQTGINITGAINTPETAQIDINLPINWTVSNGNAQNLSNIPVSVALYRGDSDTPFTTLPASQVSLDANGKATGTVNWMVQGVEGDKITAVLVGTFGDTQKTLGMTSFTLTEPKIEVNLPTQPKSDTLLVYYACEDGWYTSLSNSGAGNFDYPCFNERETIIRSYLDRMGVNYKLVKHPWQFRHEMQSGLYGQYWLLGAIENLSPHTYNEIVELTNSGQNILFDSGTHSWLNQDLYKLANVKFGGRLLLKNGEITPNSYYFPLLSDAQIAGSQLLTQTKLAGQPYNSNWAIILQPKTNNVQSLATFSGALKQVGGLNQANYPNQTYNAMSAATYGNGVPVVAGFDLIGSLDFARKTSLPPYKANANVMQLRWDSILEQLLKSRTIKPRSEYAPNEPVRIPLNYSNTASSDRKIQVDVKLPTGSTWLGFQGGMNATPSTELEQHYQLTLKANQTLQDVLAIRLPQTSGTHNMQITVNDITNAHQPRRLDQFEVRFLVRDISSRVAVLKQAIGTWRIVGTNGSKTLSAKLKISLIQTHLNTGVDELTVYEAGNLAHILSDMQVTPTQDVVALRYEADELLRALQIKWYLARNGKPPLP